MKKQICLVIILICLGFIACNEDDTIELPDFGPVANDTYIGTWNWDSTGSGQTGQIFNPLNNGEKQLILTGNSAYSLTSDGETLFSGEYAVILPDSTNGLDLDFIAFADLDLEIALFNGRINLINDSLLIAQGPDRFLTLYLRD